METENKNEEIENAVGIPPESAAEEAARDNGGDNGGVEAQSEAKAEAKPKGAWRKTYVRRAKFIEAMKKVMPVVPAKHAFQICSYVKIEAKNGHVSITGTNLDVAITAKTATEGTATGDFAFAAPARLLSQCLETMPETEICVAYCEGANGGKVALQTGTSCVKLRTLLAADFPKWSNEDVAFACRMKGVDLREMLRKTSFAASKTESRKTLMGTALQFIDGNARFTATDGRVLATVSKKPTELTGVPADVVLPPVVVSELTRSFGEASDTLLQFTKNHVIASTDNVRLRAKLMDTVYPNWKQVVPNERKNVVALNRTQLIDAASRAAIFSIENDQRMKCVFTQNLLTVSGQTSESGNAEEKIGVKYGGDKVEIFFNPALVSAMLKTLSSCDVSFGFNGGVEPAVVKAEEYGFTGVVMPLRG